jgi:uracil-DNA glycosylase
MLCDSMESACSPYVRDFFLSPEKTVENTDDGRLAQPRLSPAQAAWFAAGIRTLLRFHGQLGIDSYPLTPALRQNLQETGHKGPVGQQSAPVRHRHISSALSPDAGTAFPTEATSERLRLLQAEVETCSLCGLAAVQQGRSHGGGGTTHSPLLIIGDYCRADTGSAEGMHFGVAEDIMLWKMMQAIGVTAENVFVTNAIKCCLPVAIRPDETSLRSCRAFLHREIALIRPRIICAMGDMAAQVLLDSHETVLRLRGKRHHFRCGGDPSGEIPVMVTFHPHFLREYPDLKKAAWEDLQKLQKQLPKTSSR